MHGDEFEVRTARVGDGTFVVTVSGELDLYTVPQLEEELERAKAPGAARVVVDLAGVSFMDSTALGALVRAHREVRLAAGELALVSDDPRVARLFAITGLERVIRVHPSLIDAIDDLVQMAAAR
jgi:anti-sigma B factor antagonist